MSTTTSILSGLDPFAARSSYLSPRGTRIYHAPTWLHSDGPNGRYEIEQLSPRMWVVTHRQTISQGADAIVRRVSGVAAKTKAAAIGQAEEDSHNLQDNVMRYLLNHKTVNARLAQIA